MKRKTAVVTAVIALVVVLVAGVIAWRTHGFAVSKPTPSASSPGYSFWEVTNSHEGDVDDWALVDCQGMKVDVIQKVFIPFHYDYGDDGYVCSFGNQGVYVESLVPTNTSATEARQIVDPQAEADSAWGSSFTYQFPASMGWGGALWTEKNNGYSTRPLSYSPSSAAHSDRVWAILCADDEHCLWLEIKRSYFPALKPNANGVLDPVWSAVTLLESAWRTLSVESPDLVPMTVPAVNPSPYVPLTSPPYPGATPSGGST